MELEQCGLSPMDVIVAATRNTADAMGVLDRLGTLEPGKRADLLVVNCNPLVNVAPLYKQETILLVMKDGEVESCGEEYRQHLLLRRC